MARPPTYHSDDERPTPVSVRIPRELYHQAKADQALQDKVTRYFAQGRGTYGTRRIKHLLAQAGSFSFRIQSR